MSLVLDRGDTKPKGLRIKTIGKIEEMGINEDVVMLGDYDISIEDFLIAAHYVLTNADLYPEDPRLQFVKSVVAMTSVEGNNPGGLRLKTKVPPVEGYFGSE